MISEKDGILKNDLALEEFKKLESFNEMFVQKKGTKITKTIDFVTSPGTIHLVHSSIEQLVMDEAKIREIEASNSF